MDKKEVKEDNAALGGAVSAPARHLRLNKEAGTAVGYMTDGGQFVRSLGPEVAGMSLFLNEIAKIEEYQKSIDPPSTSRGVSNKDKEIGEDRTFTAEGGIIEPPWNYEVLSQLVDRNTTHGAAIDRKSSDYCMHGWHLEVRPEVKDKVDKKELERARVEVVNFLEGCVKGETGFLPIQYLIKDVASDYEGLGSGGFEIVRDSKGAIHHMNHIPFVTMRVLKAKVLDSLNEAHFVQKRFHTRRYFVPLGRNVQLGRKNAREPFNPSTESFEKFPSLDKREGFRRLPPTFLDFESPDEETTDTDRAANEFISVCRPPKNESTVYGKPAALTAFKSMLGEMLSDEYNINFFRSKGVPQYAVLVKGLQSSVDGTVDHDAVAAATAEIEEFFSKHIQNVDRPVLILSSTGGAEFVFERLSPDKVDEAFSIKYPDRCRDRIRMAHRMPPAALGIVETAQLGAGVSSYQFRDYRTHIVTPGQDVFASVVNLIIRHGLLIPFFDFKFNEMPIEDEQQAKKFHLDEYVQGAITPNEYRQETGRAPYTTAEGKEDLGDSLIIRTSQVAVLNPEGDVVDTTTPGDSIPTNSNGKSNGEKIDVT